MRRWEFSIAAGGVQRQAQDWLQDWLSVAGTAQAWLASFLIGMACRRISLSLAAKCYRIELSGERVRQLVRESLPDEQRLQECFLESVAALVPRRVRRRGWLLAIDLHSRPYYGQEQASVRRGQSRQGTRLSFTYASCCVVRANQRWSIAVRPVPAAAKLEEVVAELLAQVRKLGWNVRGLLLDRGFYSAAVISELQRRRIPFVIPMIQRGRRMNKPATDTGTTRFFRRGSRGHFTHHWAARGKPSAGPTVQVRVACVPHHDRRRRPLVYAYHGLRWSLNYINQTYRRRFGIETSYRELGEALAKTTSRCPKYRLLLVLMALLLRNLWIQCKASLKRRLEFTLLLDTLAQAISAILSIRLPPATPPPPLTTALPKSQ
jgi:hypothetical protein